MGWATEYARKAMSVTVDEIDWRAWLDANSIPETAPVPHRVKFRIFLLLAEIDSLRALAEHHVREGEPEAHESVTADIAVKDDELGNWAKGLREKFGAAAGS